MVQIMVRNVELNFINERKIAGFIFVSARTQMPAGSQYFILIYDV